MACSSRRAKVKGAERGMKVEEDGPSPGLPLTPRELLCLESDSRWERGVAYLALFPPPSSAESFVPPSPLPFIPRDEKERSYSCAVHNPDLPLSTSSIEKISKKQR